MITDGNFPDSIGVMLDGTGFIPYFSGYQNLKNIAMIDKKDIEALCKHVYVVENAGLRKKY